jgi:hypothetical protein
MSSNLSVHALVYKEKFWRHAKLWLAAKKNQRCFLSAEVLFKVKNFALRRGVWFKALSRIERGVLDLTIKCVDHVRSAKLLEVLIAIVEKLEQATESMVDRLMRVVGIPLSQKVSGLAVSWGNVSAKSWASDLSFAVFLAVMNKNN